MTEMLSIKAIAGAQAKAYDSGFSATFGSLFQLRHRLSVYKDASDMFAKIPVVDSTQGPVLQCSYEHFLSVKSALDSAKLGVVQSAQSVKQHYPYDYWSMKSALDYAETVASSRPRRKWYGARRNVRSAAIVKSGTSQVIVIDGRRRDVVSISDYSSGGKIKFRHHHAPEANTWLAGRYRVPSDHLSWFVAAGTVSLPVFGYELLLAKGSLKENLFKSLAVTAALLAVPIILTGIDMLPRKARKPADAERVLEPQEFLDEAAAACTVIEEALKSVERDINRVLFRF